MLKCWTWTTKSPLAIVKGIWNALQSLVGHRGRPYGYILASHIDQQRYKIRPLFSTVVYFLAILGSLPASEGTSNHQFAPLVPHRMYSCPSAYPFMTYGPMTANTPYWVLPGSPPVAHGSPPVLHTGWGKKKKVEKKSWKKKVEKKKLKKKVEKKKLKKKVK